MNHLLGITLQVALRPILYPSISSPSLTNNTSNSNDGNNSHDSKSKHNWSNMQVPFLFGLLTLSLVCRQCITTSFIIRKTHSSNYFMMFNNKTGLLYDMSINI